HKLPQRIGIVSTDTRNEFVAVWWHGGAARFGLNRSQFSRVSWEGKPGHSTSLLRFLEPLDGSSNLREDRGPLSELRLPEQTHRRIPGRIVAMLKPPPIDGDGQCGPDGHGQRAGQMGD